MGMSEIVARGVAMVGAAADPDAPLGRRDRRARGGRARPRSRAARPQGIPTLKMPTARGWSGGRTPVAAPGLEGQRLRRRPQASALDPRAAERRRADRRGAGRRRARSAPPSTTPSTARCGAPPPSAQPQPHHAAARRRRRRRGRGARDLPRQAAPALRHGAGRRHLLRRQHRRRRGLPLHAGRDPHHRPRARASPSSSPAGTGRRSLLAEPRRAQALRRRRLAQQHRRARHGRPRRAAPRSTRSTSRPAPRASSPAACATRSASPGSPRPARSGRWSTSATASATRRRPTT